MTFSLFSPLHIGLLVLVATAGTVLGLAAKRHPERRRAILRAGAGILTILELIWYGYLLQRPYPVWPGILPLHLCDIVVWLTVISSFTRIQRVRELAYYFGFAGTTLALLMPDVQGLRLSYPVLQFFVSHGLVVVLLLVLVISGEFRPGRGSLVFAVVVLHLYAGVLGIFNAAFGTNYMYLCSRPGGDSILDLMGGWPWYLLGADVLGILLFWLLWIPVRKSRPDLP